MRKLGVLALLLVSMQGPGVSQDKGAVAQAGPESLKECHSKLLKTALRLNQGSHAILDKNGPDSKVFFMVRSIDIQLKNATDNIRMFQTLSKLKEAMACDADRAAVAESLRITSGLAEMALLAVKMELNPPTRMPAEMPADAAQDIKTAAELVESSYKFIADFNKKLRDEKKGDKK